GESSPHRSFLISNRSATRSRLGAAAISAATIRLLASQSRHRPRINHARMAAMLTYLSAALSVGVSPFWPHLILLSVSVLAGVAVGAGIIFEAPEYSAATHRKAKWARHCRRSH